MQDISSSGQSLSGNTSQNVQQPAPADLDDLKGRVQDDLGAVTDAVKSGASSAVDKVSETVTEQTNFAARQVGGVATVLQKVGAELENGDQPQVGRYAKQIGESVQAIAKKMEGRDLGQIAGMAEDFGRQQPLAFLGVAALAGLAASRFLTASAKRSTSSPNSTKQSGSPDAGAPTPIGLMPSNGGSANG